jgi:hypothetical protein
MADNFLGTFYGQDLVWLTTLRTSLRDAITAVTLGKTVSIAGRLVTREDLSNLTAALRAVQVEIDRQNGAAQPSRTIYTDFSN